MALYPDVEWRGVRVLRPEGDGLSATLQFQVLAEVLQPEGMQGDLEFWVEADSGDAGDAVRLAPEFAVSLGPGSYEIPVPPEPLQLPASLYTKRGVFLFVIGEYVRPTSTVRTYSKRAPRPEDYRDRVFTQAYALSVDPVLRLRKLEPLDMRATNPKLLSYDLPGGATVEPEAGEGDIGGEDDSGEEEEQEQEGEEDESGSEEEIGSLDTGDDDDSESDVEPTSPGGMKRTRDDEEDDGPPGKAPRLECANCLREAFYQCSRCANTYYCDKVCQAAHYAQHRETCT